MEKISATTEKNGEGLPKNVLNIIKSMMMMIIIN